MIEKLSWLYLLLALSVGMLLPMQPAINKQLRDHVGSPWLASLVSFSVGTVALATAVLLFVVLRGGLPQLADVKAAPWWAWVGGLIGAVFVTASIVLVPKLGVVLLVGAVLCGQLVSSVAIDHFGWVGMEQQRVNPGRVAGVALLLAGVLMIQLSTERRAPPSPEMSETPRVSASADAAASNARDQPDGSGGDREAPADRGKGS